MNDLDKGKSNLQKALLEVSENYLKNVEFAREEKLRYSPKLEKKMEKLLRAQQKPYWNFVNTAGKKAIAACLAVVVLAGALMSCKPIREPAVQFFKNVYEQYTEFFFDSKDKAQAPGLIEELHTLTYIPDGYTLTVSPVITVEDYSLDTIWENEDGNKITLSQRVLSGKSTVDTENATVKTIYENDIEIFIIIKENRISIFWNTEEYAYLLDAHNLTEEEMLKMVKSLK